MTSPGLGHPLWPAETLLSITSRTIFLTLSRRRFAGTAPACGGADPGRRNITTPLTRSLSGGTGLPRLDTSRLRATWLAEVAELLGLATFMHAAGITCSQRLGDLLATLDPAGEAGAVKLLGGTR